MNPGKVALRIMTKPGLSRRSSPVEDRRYISLAERL